MKESLISKIIAWLANMADMLANQVEEGFATCGRTWMGYPSDTDGQDNP